MKKRRLQSDLFSKMTIAKKSKPDKTANKLLYLIQDESPSTKEFVFEVCKAIIQARKKK